MTDAPLPKEQLLRKLLKMTTSSQDGEALTAIRKANELMKAAGWDWDKLLDAKIRIVENPFANLGNPLTNSPVSAPSRPAPTYQSPPTPPPPQKRTTWPLGISPNRFAAPCYCCGIEVLSGTGIIFKPGQYCNNATMDWKVSCYACNNSATVVSYAAPRQRGSKKKPFVSDLA